MENLYDYFFWFNHYENLWYAIPRNSVSLFFGGKKDSINNLFSHQDLDILISKMTS